LRIDGVIDYELWKRENVECVVTQLITIVTEYQINEVVIAKSSPTLCDLYRG